MEEKIIGYSASEFASLIKAAKAGDNDAMEILLKLFDPEIQSCSRYISMPREEAIQTLRAEFVAIVRGEKSLIKIVPKTRIKSNFTFMARQLLLRTLGISIMVLSGKPIS